MEQRSVPRLFCMVRAMVPETGALLSGRHIHTPWNETSLRGCVEGMAPISDDFFSEDQPSTSMIFQIPVLFVTALQH